MREDIAKIIVERPRLGSRTSTSDDPKGYKRRISGRDSDLEDLPSKESMTKKYGYDGKQLNENLAPLRRFLLKSAGRLWDDVFSEISEQINLSSAVKRHILEHVFDTVEKNTFIAADGSIWSRSRGGTEWPIEESYADLFVHPASGILTKIKSRRKTKKARSQHWRETSERRIANDYGLDDAKLIGNSRYEKRKGIWYVVELRPIPKPLSETISFEMGEGEGEDEDEDKREMIVPTPTGLVKDVCLGTSLFNLYDEKKGADKAPRMMWNRVSLSHYYGRSGVYGAKIKQANSKELKAAGLKNDPQEAE